MGKSFLQEAWDEGEQAGMATGIAEGKRVGIAEGEQAGIDKGHVEGKVEVAQRLVQMGFDSDMVHKATGLSNDEIDALRPTLNGQRH